MLKTTLCFGVCTQQHSQCGVHTCFLVCGISFYGLYTYVFHFIHPLKYYFGQFQIAYASMFRSETNGSIVIASTGKFTNQRFMVNKLTGKIKNEIKSYVDAAPFRFSVARSTCCTPFS
jgi:hypothetical protein